MKIRRVPAERLDGPVSEPIVDVLAAAVARQKEALDIIERHGFVFATAAGKMDPSAAERWEKLAFTFYTLIVDGAMQADALLAERDEQFLRRTRDTIQSAVPGGEVTVFSATTCDGLPFPGSEP